MVGVVTFANQKAVTFAREEETVELLKLMQHDGSTLTLTWAPIACGWLDHDGRLPAKGHWPIYFVL